MKWYGLINTKKKKKQSELREIYELNRIFIYEMDYKQAKNIAR